MEQMTVQASPRERLMAFLAAFQAADNDADIEIRIGHMEGGEPAIVVSLNEAKHVMTVKEARVLATIMEDAMNAHPNHPDAATLPNTIMALRMSADRSESEQGGHQ